MYQPYTTTRVKITENLIRSNKVKFVKKLIPSSYRKFMREQVLVKKQEKPKMDNKSREILTKYYWNDVMKLKTLIKRELPWTNFQN